MASEATTKIRVAQGRHTLYLPTDLVRDSTFPFKPEEDALVVRVDGARLVVEKAGRKR